MQFTIGATAYAVRVSPRKIFNQSGEELWAYCDGLQREIVLSPDLPPERRAKVLRHEVWHEWCQLVPMPSDEEQQATLFATAGEAFDEQINVAELAAMEPSERATVKTAVPANGVIQETWLTDRIECPACHRSILCGDIVSGPPVELRELRTFQVDRWCECPACGIVTTWSEAATEGGKPLGVYIQVPPPRILRDEDARRFIAERRGSAGRRLVACD